MTYVFQNIYCLGRLNVADDINLLNLNTGQYYLESLELVDDINFQRTCCLKRLDVTNDTPFTNRRVFRGLEYAINSQPI